MMDLAAATAEFTILAFAGLLIAAAASDWQRFIVPNRYSLAIVALFVPYAITSGAELQLAMSVGLAVGFFFFGFLLFTLGFCGGGDVKLFAAVTLWAGPLWITDLVFYTAFCGGLMAVILWLHRRFNRSAVPVSLNVKSTSETIAKQPMPYAVAIAAGGLFVALQLLLGV
ncbi:MAG: prepilin peptidase [Kiloniellaceae bacterium]